MRSLSVNHWGSELGLNVLKRLSDLYLSLVWESSVLIALCSDSVIPTETGFGQADLQRVMAPEFKTMKMEKEGSSSKMLDGELETLLARSELGSDGVSTAMESLSTSEAATVPMETEDAVGSQGGATQKTNKLKEARIRQIKPLLTVSSRLGRSVAELFGLLVKLSVGSPTRQRRAQQLAPLLTTPTQAARAVAQQLSTLLAQGLHYKLPDYCPAHKLRLDFIKGCS